MVLSNDSQESIEDGILQMARVNSNPVGTFAAKLRKPGWNFYKKRAKIQKRNEAAWNCLPGKEENDVRRKKGNCGCRKQHNDRDDGGLCKGAGSFFPYNPGG